jgi:hypothetical protein
MSFQKQTAQDALARAKAAALAKNEGRKPVAPLRPPAQATPPVAAVVAAAVAAPTPLTPPSANSKAGKAERAARKEQRSALRAESAALKALGAAITPEQRERRKAIRAEIAALGNGGDPKAKIVRALRSAEKAISAAQNKYVGVPDVLATLTAILSTVEAAVLTRKARPAKEGKAAKAPKAQIALGSVVTVKDKVRSKFAEIIDGIDGEFTVTKIVGKQARISDGNGVQSVIALNAITLVVPAVAQTTEATAQ